MAKAYKFNGLISTILPNVYINKITLEGKNFSNTLADLNATNNASLHINTVTGAGAGGPTWPDANAGTLKIIYDMSIEVPEFYQGVGEVFKGVLDQTFYGNSALEAGGFFEYIKVAVMTFKGEKAKKTYLNIIEGDVTAPSPTTPTVEKIVSHFESGWSKGLYVDPGLPDSLNNLNYHTNFEFTTKRLWKNWPDVLSVGGDPLLLKKNKANEDPKEYLKHLKDKYRHVLPNGLVVYKIPLQIVQELQGEIYPNELAAIATCTIDYQFIQEAAAKIFEGTESAAAGAIESYSAWTKYGRHATEVIIDGGKVPEKGMLFFISKNQIDDDESKSHMRQAAFGDLSGQLWFGGVHKYLKRYMAGNEHLYYSEIQPYLDYILVDNNRVMDYRIMLAIKKQLLNFQPLSELIFGGSYYNLQSKVATADFSELAGFSNLISSIERGKTELNNRIKLFFSIDQGKVLKRYCAIPRILDQMAQSAEVDMDAWMSSNFNYTSFKIYRERLDVPNNIINQNKRELIYDGYNHVWFYKKIYKENINGETVLVNQLNPTSALVPVGLKYGNEAGNGASGHMKHFTLTDYDSENTRAGIFKYSVEFEFYDPTLDYFLNSYKIILDGLTPLKTYIDLINGSHNKLGSPVINYFDATTGKFDNKFITGVGGKFYSEKEDLFKNAFSAMKDIIKLTRYGTMAEKYEASTFDNYLQNLNSMNYLSSAINPQNVTPEGANLVYDALNTIAIQLKKLIDSFNTVKIPKIESTIDPDTGASLSPKYQTVPPIGGANPRRIIKVIHEFDDPAELVNTKKTDAAYEYFGYCDNKSLNSIGLKVIGKYDYDGRSNEELVKYFENPGMIFSMKYKNLTLGVLANNTAGRYFTVPFGWTFLPSYVVGFGTEKQYWQVINNIIRYKLNLLGDIKPGAQLGYGQYDAIPGYEIINDEMERILKEYQTLSQNATYFLQKTTVTETDPAVSYYLWNDSTDETETEMDPGNQPEGSADKDDSDNESPFPSGGDSGDSNESQTKVESDEEKLQSMEISWAKNYGQERLLLSLICGNSFNLNLADMRLNSFDTDFSGGQGDSPIKIAINNYILKNPSKTPSEAATEYLRSLPNPIIALILCSTSGPNLTLQDPFKYWKTPSGGIPPLYHRADDLNLEPGLSSRMFMDRFGQFWFNHQNLGEIEYLAGYETTTAVPPIEIQTSDEWEAAFGSIYASANQEPANSGTKYEDIYNSCLNSPIWKPLTMEKVSLFGLDTVGQLLCRTKKYQNTLFNQRAYSSLDLPLYDEYFLIGWGSVNTNVNAFIEKLPNKTDKMSPEWMPGDPGIPEPFKGQQLPPLPGTEEPQEL